MSRRAFMRGMLATSTLSSVGPSIAAAAGAEQLGVQVRPRHGLPMWYVEGHPDRTPIFETYAPNPHHFEQFAAAGTRVFSFSTNLGWGFAAPTWIGPQDFDFRQLDQFASQVLQACPTAWLLPRIYLSAPDWWADANPAECVELDGIGSRFPEGLGHGRDGRRFPALVSSRWRQESGRALERLLNHLQRSEYGDRLFGVLLTGMMSEEWYHWSIHSRHLGDYSPPTRAAFRRWLATRYQDDSALQKAWHRPDIQLDGVEIPSANRRRADRERTFRDPRTEKDIIDWYQFYNEIVPDTIRYYCGVARRTLARPAVIGAFYAYMFEFGGDPEFGHNALGHLLKVPDLDFLQVTASYFDRTLGAGADYARAPVKSVQLHGKLWNHDNDTVSFRYDEMNRNHPDRQVVERYRRELGVTANAQETRWMYQRGAGFALCQGMTQSFFDLHGGYFDDPELMNEVAILNQVFRRSIEQPADSIAEVLFVYDEPSCNYVTFESPMLAQVLQPLQVQLAKMGTSHDAILLDDLERCDMSRYRLVVFVNTYHLSAKQHAMIRRCALGDGRHVMWATAPGLFYEGEEDLKAGEDLTGLRLRRAFNAQRVQALMRWNASDHPWFLATHDDIETPIASPHVWLEALTIDPDKKTSVLARRDSDGAPAIAIRPMENWTSYYVLNPVLHAAVWRALLQSIGVHVFQDRSETLYVNQRYLVLNADGPGTRTLRWPSRVSIYDARTERQLAKDVSQYQVTLRDRETLMLRFDRSS